MVHISITLLKPDLFVEQDFLEAGWRKKSQFVHLLPAFSS